VNLCKLVDPSVALTGRWGCHKVLQTVPHLPWLRFLIHQNKPARNNIADICFVCAVTACHWWQTALHIYLMMVSDSVQSGWNSLLWVYEAMFERLQTLFRFIIGRAVFEILPHFWITVCTCSSRMLCRFSSLSQGYLRERREDRSRYIQRKRARYASSRKSRHFAHMDYVVDSRRVGICI